MYYLSKKSYRLHLTVCVGLLLLCMNTWACLKGQCHKRLSYECSLWCLGCGGGGTCQNHGTICRTACTCGGACPPACRGTHLTNKDGCLALLTENQCKDAYISGGTWGAKGRRCRWDGIHAVHPCTANGPVCHFIPG